MDGPTTLENQEAFYGSIGRTEIWSRALGSEEINNMTTAPDPNSADLVGMWMLNELTGTVAYDVGENQIDGTLIGDPVRTFILSEISDTLQASENSTTLTGLANYSEYAHIVLLQQIQQRTLASPQTMLFQYHTNLLIISPFFLRG